MMTEDRKQKLQELQTTLEKRGIKDIKFFFSDVHFGMQSGKALRLTDDSKDINELADSVISVLESYLNDECRPLPNFNSSYRDRTLP